MDPMRTCLLDLLYELRDQNVPLTVGGGFGLFLKRMHLAERATRTLFAELPEPRATNDICQSAGRRARLARQISPHTLRHACATHLLEGGTDIRTIQRCWGPASRTTALYTYVSLDKVAATTSPIDRLAGPDSDKAAGGQEAR